MKQLIALIKEKRVSSRYEAIEIEFTPIYNVVTLGEPCRTKNYQSLFHMFCPHFITGVWNVNSISS